MEHTKGNSPVNRDGWWLIAAISPLLLLGGWMLWPDRHEPTLTWSSAETPPGKPREIPSQWHPPVPVSRPGEARFPAENAVEAAQAPVESADIRLDRLQHALANIAVDQDGNLVLDEVALASLQQAFRAVENVDMAMLEELQLYVQAGLAGETGAQAAEILGDYVRYRSHLAKAEAEWSSQQELSPNQRLERTIALRRQYIDPVAASQLFAGEDAHQRYLIAMEDIRSDPSLTGQARRQALAQVREDLRRGTLLVDSSDGAIASQLRTDRERWQQLGLTNETRRHLEQQSLGLVAARDLAGSDPQDWQRRYRQFDQEREVVLRAGLAEDEKQRQIEGLVDTYFTKSERDAAEAWLPPHLRLEAVR